MPYECIFPVRGATVLCLAIAALDELASTCAWHVKYPRKCVSEISLDVYGDGEGSPHKDLLSTGLPGQSEQPFLPCRRLVNVCHVVRKITVMMCWKHRGL